MQDAKIFQSVISPKGYKNLRNVKSDSLLLPLRNMEVWSSDLPSDITLPQSGALSAEDRRSDGREGSGEGA